MTTAGLSISDDLACVVIYDGIRPLAYKAFSYADGRAFPGCLYWHQWVSEKQVVTHEPLKPGEELDFLRVLKDLAFEYQVSVIGFDPKEIQIGPPRGLAIASDDPRMAASLDTLRCTAYLYEGLLFPEGSLYQWFWRSVESGSGRTDGILALCRAMAAAKA